MSTSQIARTAEPLASEQSDALLFSDHAWATAKRWVELLSLPLLIVFQVILSLRLRNTPHDDEALYIQAGRELLAHWRTGASVVEFGVFFSGAPAAYPVLAGLLDETGGLWLVRAFSLACIVIAMLCIRATSAHLFGIGAGNLAAFAFAATGPVAFLSAHATFDALCLMLLSVALWLGIAKTSYSSAVLIGLTLATAAVVKYTGAAFVPVVLAVVWMAAYRQDFKRQFFRMACAGLIAVAALAMLYMRWGDKVHEGIFYTTTGREPLSPAPAAQLFQYIVQDIGLLIALALVGGFLVIRSWQSMFLLLVLFAGASGLLLSQIYLGEAMSFEKHTAYSAIFLAPLAGRALVILAKPTVSAVVLAVLMGLFLAFGVGRSSALYNQWPNVNRVVETVIQLFDDNAEPGQYFSTQASQLRYYTYEKYPQTQWVAHYSVYNSEPEAVRQLIEERTFRMIVWRSGSTGNPREDAILNVFRQAALDSPHYELAFEPFPVEGWPGQKWYVLKLEH